MFIVGFVPVSSLPPRWVWWWQGAGRVGGHGDSSNPGSLLRLCDGVLGTTSTTSTATAPRPPRRSNGTLTGITDRNGNTIASNSTTGITLTEQPVSRNRRKVPMNNIVVAEPLVDAVLRYLQDHATIKNMAGRDRASLLAEMKTADAIIVRSATKVDRDMLSAAPRLRVIGRAGVGMDNIDIEWAEARGINVVNTPHANIHSAAEHAVALILSTMRRIPAAHLSLINGKWNRSSFQGRELFGSTVGVVGAGNIGSLVAERLKSFGTQILAYDPHLSQSRAAAFPGKLVDLPTLLGSADVITIHLPLTHETKHLIGANELAASKHGVVVVNASRGGVIDEGALAAAILDGTVSAAALDVFEIEPCTDSPLFGLSNVVVTPHLGASTREASLRAGTQLAENVVQLLTPDVVGRGLQAHQEARLAGRQND